MAWRRQAIIWTNAGILLIEPLGTNFSENVIKILTFSFTKMLLKVSSAKWRPFGLGLNVLTMTHVLQDISAVLSCDSDTVTYEISSSNENNQLMLLHNPFHLICQRFQLNFRGQLPFLCLINPWTTGVIFFQQNEFQILSVLKYEAIIFQNWSSPKSVGIEDAGAVTPSHQQPQCWPKPNHDTKISNCQWVNPQPRLPIVNDLSMMINF